MRLRRITGCLVGAASPQRLGLQRIPSFASRRKLSLFPAISAISQQQSDLKYQSFSTSAMASNVIGTKIRNNDQNFTQIDKPISDTRLYRHIILDNKLEVFLISDPNCDRAACSLNVGVGSLHDPKDLPGLAHFVEHMLFLGTKKYSDEEEYNKYLQEHGGRSNAYTSDLNTCYHFSLTPEFLDGAVDRFTQFFLEPLFTQSATDRELDAIHSEHSKNLLADQRRHYQILKTLSNPKHPFHRFGTGNHQTLRDDPKGKGIDVRSALLDFHKKYYSANIMRVAILGRESLDELEQMIRTDRFDLVNNADVILPKGEQIGAPEVAFRKEDLGKMVRIIPVRDVRTIDFQWLLPEQTDRWRTKPTHYLSHLLGHEGTNSLLSALKAEELVTELLAGVYVDSAGMSLFQVKMHLTELGLSDAGIKRIGQLVHEYIRLLSTNEIQDWVVEELKQLAFIQFQFLSQIPPEAHVVNITHAMHHYPPQHVLSGSILSWDKDFAEIKQMIDCLKPENLLVFLSAKSLREDFDKEPSLWETEHFYQSVYQTEPLSQDLLDFWLLPLASDQIPINFPKPNPFVPQNLKLKSCPNVEAPSYPKLISASGRNRLNARLYFKQDDTFNLPKAITLLRFYSPYQRKGIKEITITELYLSTIKQLMIEYAYDAEMSGLKYGINATIDSAIQGDLSGFEIQVAGFDDKLFELLIALCKAIRTPELTEKAFDVAKTVFLRNLQIMTNNKQPYQQALAFRDKYMVTPYHLPEDRLRVAESVTFEDICTLAKGDLFHDLSLDVLIQGNITEEEARGLLGSIDNILLQDKLSLSSNGTSHAKIASTIGSRKVIDISTLDGNPARYRVIKIVANPDEVNGASILCIQLGLLDIPKAGLLNVATTYLHQPFFDALRTKQQCGYIVASTGVNILHTNAIQFLVQSQRFTPRNLTLRIEAFLEQFLINVENHLTVAEFEKIKNATIAQLEERPKQLEEEATRYYREIVIRRFDFTRRYQLAEFLKIATYDQFIDFVKYDLMKSPWFVIEMEPHKFPVEEICEMSDISSVSPTTAINWVEICDSAEDFQKKVNAFDEMPLPVV